MTSIFCDPLCKLGLMIFFIRFKVFFCNFNSIFCRPEIAKIGEDSILGGMLNESSSVVEKFLLIRRLLILLNVA